MTAEISPMAAALAFLKAIPAIDRIIVGVADSAQLREILGSYEQRPEALPYERFAQSDPALIDPRKW